MHGHSFKSRCLEEEGTAVCIKARDTELQRKHYQSICRGNNDDQAMEDANQTTGLTNSSSVVSNQSKSRVNKLLKAMLV